MVKEIRYTEIFYSLQGEGRYVGVPSVFFRTFGCNFRCMNFGLPRGTPKGRYNPEVAKLIEDRVHETTVDFKDLPIIHTGCDTYASIYPEFKHLNQSGTPEEIAAKLLNDVPNHRWSQDNGQDVHLIFTGGEPLLGWQTLYADMLSQPEMRDLRHVTFETNATQHIKPALRKFIEDNPQIEFIFSCSPKLSVSGETWEDAIKPAIVREYANLPNSNVYLKFVVADAVDVGEVRNAVMEYHQQANMEYPVYLMPLGGRSEGYDLTVAEVAKLAMDEGWRFTPRLHIDLFGNAWGT